mmetsp:Transcript_49358/g.155222  ORF Transcript_49358/g.155222 Transcript_49358/m.155222 type:complete len:203 (+) Transcript_49358:1812-2420(+)
MLASRTTNGEGTRDVVLATALRGDKRGTVGRLAIGSVSEPLMRGETTTLPPWCGDGRARGHGLIRFGSDTMLCEAPTRGQREAGSAFVSRSAVSQDLANWGEWSRTGLELGMRWRAPGGTATEAGCDATAGVLCGGVRPLPSGYPWTPSSAAGTHSTDVLAGCERCIPSAVVVPTAPAVKRVQAPVLALARAGGLPPCCARA